MRNLFRFIFLFLIFFSGYCYSQINNDSLVKVFHFKFENENAGTAAADTVFANYAHDICSNYLDVNDLFSAYKYNTIEQQIYEKLKFSYPNKAYLTRAQYRCAYSRISILERRESYNEALDLSFALLKTLDSTVQKERFALVEDEIGYIYYLFGNFPRALVFYTRSCELIKQTGDPKRIGAAYINLYGVHSALGDRTTAIKYCFSALNCFKKINYKEGMRVSYGNLAMYYENTNPDKALSYVLLSKELRNGEVDYTNPGMEDNSLGTLYLRKASTEKNAVKRNEYLNLSETHLKEAKRIGEMLHNKGVLKDCIYSLAALEHERKNFETAFDYIILYNQYKDSLRGEENSNASYKSLLKYEFDKKEQKQRDLMDKKEALKQKEVEKQKIQKNFFIGGFILVSICAIFIFRSYKGKQKANRVISQQKTEVETQKQIVETKQSQLLHSINYAHRIQDNLLKTEEDLRKLIKDSFIIFKPRDIVSGDFYWFTKTDGNDVIIMLADCTGHGVPGALLSMIGITAINEIVNHQKVYDPGEILHRLSSDVHDAFSHGDSATKMDGMDISVCKISYSQNKLFFAGVNQSLYVVDKNNSIKKLEPQVNSINGIFDIRPDEKIVPTELILESGTGFYLFSDGIIDQIGEKISKKYLSPRFEVSLKENSETIFERKDIIEKRLAEWQGNHKQIDDISVIGFSL